MKKDLLWVEYNYIAMGSVIARVKCLDKLRIDLFEIKVKEILFLSGNYTRGDWKQGSVTTLTKSDIKNYKDTIKFVFKEMK